jgi:hypothetical protein
MFMASILVFPHTLVLPFPESAPSFTLHDTFAVAAVSFHACVYFCIKLLRVIRSDKMTKKKALSPLSCTHTHTHTHTLYSRIKLTYVYTHTT